MEASGAVGGNGRPRYSDDERLDLLDELVFDLEVPCRLGDVDHEEQIGDEQGLHGGHSEMLQPLADPHANGEIVRLA